MANFNTVTFIGTIVREIEAKFIPSSSGSQTKVINNAIAVNRKYRDKEEVMFMDFSVFGKKADLLEQYTEKGKQILIQGYIKQEEWEQDGQKRSKHKVVVEKLQIIGFKANVSESDAAAMAADDDDIPF